MYLTSLS
jgi:glucan 1,3-beta-glucosidase